MINANDIIENIIIFIEFIPYKFVKSIKDWSSIKLPILILLITSIKFLSIELIISSLSMSIPIINLISIDSIFSFNFWSFAKFTPN